MRSIGAESTKRVLTTFGFQQGFHNCLEAQKLLENPDDFTMLGPHMPELTGFLRSDVILHEHSFSPPSLNIKLHYQNSVEAEQYVCNFGACDHPVCWWSVGYASGYCSASFNCEVYYEEISCAAQGNEFCLVVGKDAAKWGAEVERFRREYGFSDGNAVRSAWKELQEEHGHLRRQRETVLRSAGCQDKGQNTNFIRQKASECASEAKFIFRENSMLDALEQAISIARLDTAVLVQGETGTGKEFVVNTIHRQSARADRTLISINCAALTETLLESELFGHVRGAFTGAVTDRPGLFEVADKGTLFLDEIGDMPMSLQAKLLRVLENGEVRRVGSTRTICADVRVLVATHRDLQAMVETGQFRKDLYFRLNSFVITLPPLRERPLDIPAMVETFLSDISRKCGKNVSTITPEVMTVLLKHEWPGNVRELKHAIERAVLAATDGVLRVTDLPKEIANCRPPNVAKASLTLDGSERQSIARALAQHNKNRMATATALNISVSTLWRKMKKYSLIP
jgi:DNA-binding NtrC family response regulator